MNIINPRGAFDIRPMLEVDLDYVRQSWLKTYRNSPEVNFPGLIDKDFFRLTRLQLVELIARASQKKAAYVCHQPGAPGVIRGYLVGEHYDGTAFVHWVQVKKRDWGQGVASALMERFCIDHKVDLEGGHNIIYTFGAKSMTYKREGHPQHGFHKYVQNKYNLVYYPWFKATSMEFGWEAK